MGVGGGRGLRHVGLEGRTLPTLCLQIAAGALSALVFWPYPWNLRRRAAVWGGCVSRGAEAVYAITGAGEARDQSVSLREAMLQVLRSASDLSARPRASSLVASYLSFPTHEVELSLLTHPIRWGH